MPLANYLINIRYFVSNILPASLGGNHYKRIYNDTFYNNRNQDEVLGSTPTLIANYIIKTFHPASIIDFGCGTGIYLQAFADKGVEILGIDASSSALNNFRPDKSKIIIKDITQPVNLGKKFSGAICFEVAEHIPKKFSKNLIENICRASDLIIFSAAPKGQGGIGHINEQRPEFWIELFNQAGLKYLKAETNELKDYLKNNQAIFWLTNNILIFSKQK